MENGFVKLWRKSVNSRIFQNEGLWKVWTWCLMRANHKKCWVPVSTGKGETEVELNPGQFIYGRKTAAKELDMKESTVRNRIRKLKTIQNLDMQPDTHYSIITVRNWGDYQVNNKKEDTQKDNQRTGKGQPKDTDKNDKNEKNIYGVFKNVLLTEKEYGKLKEKFNSDTENQINNLSEGIASKGYKYKSHYATILSWKRRDDKKKKKEEIPIAPWARQGGTHAR